MVGAGLMGAQIGLEYALAGYEAHLINRSEEATRRALEKARDAASVLVAGELATEETAEAGLARLKAGVSLESACSRAALVVESIPEDREAKVPLFQRIGALAPEAILATNTSSLSVSDLGARSGTSRRLVGTHYWNPPTLMPLVEVVPGDQIDPAVVERIMTTLQFVGKEPVIAPDIPGFIWNRLQMALLQEAVALASRHGVAPETVDLVIRRGLGRRYSLVGPFETVALGGPATFAAVLDQLTPQLAREVSSKELTRLALPSAEALAPVRAARDRALAALLRSDRSGGTVR